ncbi:hypothetical protein C2E31_08890 [Rhodopirellula baltica]|nr:hypothetical protein C2E31_08890 [Rhodopirellula baltica]
MKWLVARGDHVIEIVRARSCDCNDQRLVVMPVLSSCPSRTSWFTCFIDALVGARSTRPMETSRRLATDCDYEHRIAEHDSRQSDA